MWRRLALSIVAAAVAGCGGDDSGQAGGAPPKGAASAGSPYITSMTVDPGDGTMLIGTGPGLFRLDPGAKRAVPMEGELATPDGSGAISRELVLRFSAPRTLLASGHPEPGSTLPDDLGLIRSQDGGKAWEVVSLLGQADLHALDVRGDRVVGQPVEDDHLLVSENGGRTFQKRTPPSMATDVDLDPANPERLIISTLDGIFTSDDAGATWRQREVLTTAAHLAWADDGRIFRVDGGGAVKTSGDAGRSWRAAGTAAGSPTTITVDAKGHLYVALPGAVIERSADGGRTFAPVTRLPAG